MIVDGVELLRMIRDGEIKAGTEIIFGKQKLYFDGDNIVYKEGKTKLLSTLWDKNFANLDFEILSEQDEETDIEAIENIEKFVELGGSDVWSNDTLSQNQRNILGKITELIKVVNQLNKKIK